MKTAPLLFVVAVVGCSEGVAPAPTTPAPAIAALKTHDGKVTILGGGGELRIAVTKDDGAVVAADATLDELRAKDPDTWMLLRSAVAQTNGTYLDATLDTHPEPAPK